MIEINNLTNFIINKKFFLGVAKKVLKGENKETENLSIAFVSPAQIQKINKKYRGKNKPADVLSFKKTLKFKDEFSEVVICPAVIKRNLKKHKTNLKRELAAALIHGILHNLGYEHEVSKTKARKMFKKQNYYIREIK